MFANIQQFSCVSGGMQIFATFEKLFYECSKDV